MKKIDLKKDLKYLYNPTSRAVTWVEVPPMNFLMVDGAGDPNTSKEFADAIQALFSVSYHLKFSIKKGPEQIDYAVMPLEALWWADDPQAFFSGDKKAWKWTAMIMQPEFIDAEQVNQAKEAVATKKNLPGLNLLRFERFEEGKAAQTLHIGPFSEEGPTIEKVHAFIKAGGYDLKGRHHEIYLSDIRRAAPEKWKTVVRQPGG